MFNNKFRIGVLQHPGYHKGKGGGGGSAQPTQSTNYTTNIPEYARPYVENMLNATQAQIYNKDMTGFNQYVPYSTDPRNYVASFSPLQSYAQSGAANLNLPANYGLATGQTLGTGMQLGALAPQMGMAGANYANMATSPMATNAYMNPYLSASLAPQLAEARRQYDITGQQQQGQAARAGAFGGSREALMAAENRRNMNQQMNQLIGQGYNQAFNQAQQAQQFGANLGLQGQQAQAGALAQQLAAANQLAGLGGQQLQAQQGIYNLQNQLGQQQQQQQQNIINQAIQNYATEQQYPFMQLGVLNSMLRGLPMQQSSTQMYQAPPSSVAQLAGLGTAGLGLSAMANQFGGAKEGGLMKIKKMSSGGNAVPMKSYNDAQLQSVLRSPASSLMADIYAQSLLNDRAYMKANPQASQIMSQPLPTAPMPAPQQMAMAPQTRVGLDAIGTGDTVQMAGGGLLAFADGDVIPPADGTQRIDPASFFDKSGQVDINKFLASELSKPRTSVAESIAPDVKEMRSMMEQRKKDAVNQALVRAGLGMMATKSPYALTGIAEGAQKGMEYYGTEGEGAQKDIKDLLDLRLKAEEKDTAREDKMIGIALNLAVNQENQKIRALTAKTNAAMVQNDKEAKEALATQGLFEKTYKDNLAQAVEDNKNAITPLSMDEMKANAYNTTYAFMAKSKLGQKHLDAYPTPEDYKTTLPTYAKPAAPAAPALNAQNNPAIGVYNPNLGKVQYK